MHLILKRNGSCFQEGHGKPLGLVNYFYLITKNVTVLAVNIF